MPERTIVVDKLKLEYEGLFDWKELFKLISEWFREKTYDWKEKVSHEHVKKEGKYIEIILEPWKALTDYVQSEIKVRIIIDDMKTVEVEKKGAKIKLNQGKITMLFDGYLTTDWEARWEGKPSYFLLRTIFDRFIYKREIHKYKKQVVEEVNQLMNEIKSFLNLYKFEYAITAPEELP